MTLLRVVETLAQGPGCMPSLSEDAAVMTANLTGDHLSKVIT